MERYLSPVSGSRTTIVLPSFSGLRATLVAAKAAAPESVMLDLRFGQII